MPCILELGFVNSVLTPRAPTMERHTSSTHIRLPAEPGIRHPSTRPTPTNPQTNPTTKQLSNTDNLSVNKHSEAIPQPTIPHNTQTVAIHHGMIYRMGDTTYKFLPPGDQHPVTRDGHEYLNIGTTQKKGTHIRQQIWLDLAAAKIGTPTPEQQPPDRTYRCPFKQTDTASKQANISSGKVYQISSGSKIKLSKPDEKYIGTIQYGKTRRTIVREIQELADPRPHTTHALPSSMADNNIWKRFQDAGKKPGKGIKPPPKKAKREPVAMSFAIAPPKHVVIFLEFLPASSRSTLAPRVRDRLNSCASQARDRLCRKTKGGHQRPPVPRRPLAEGRARSRQLLQLSLLDETRAQVCKTL